MEAGQLRDEAVRDRVRAAEEFLDPSKMRPMVQQDILANTAS